MRSAKESCTVLAQSAKLAEMTPKSFFRCVAWLLGCAIVVFTLAPIEFRPVSGAPVDLERFAASAATGAAFGLGYPKHRLRVLVLLIGIIGVLEVAQNYVPGRHGRLSDGLAKASGVLLGAAFATFVIRRS